MGMQPPRLAEDRIELAERALEKPVLGKCNHLLWVLFLAFPIEEHLIFLDGVLDVREVFLVENAKFQLLFIY